MQLFKQYHFQQEQKEIEESPGKHWDFLKPTQKTNDIWMKIPMLSRPGYIFMVLTNEWLCFGHFSHLNIHHNIGWVVQPKDNLVNASHWKRDPNLPLSCLKIHTGTFIGTITSCDSSHYFALHFALKHYTLKYFKILQSEIKCLASL